MKNNKKLNEIYAVLKQRAAELEGLWETDFLDRLIIDYRSRKEMVVLAMERVLYGRENPHYLKCIMDSKTPVKLLPNCVKYLGEHNSFSWITALLDYRKRSAPEGGRIMGWLNGNRNGFLLYRFRLMGHQRDGGQSREYWRNGLSLMRNKVFVISSLNHVYPGWEKTISDSDLHYYLKEIAKMVSRHPVEMWYKRVYIPKDATGSGALRPLGVPEISWRVYLHMWNVLLVWWTMPKLPRDQHAYQPGKGTWTAWRKLLDRALSKPNIYEFDLSNFFGNIDLEYNKKALVEMGIPEDIAGYLYRVNQSIVRLDWCGSKGDELDETVHRTIIWNSGGSANPNLPEEWQDDLNSRDESRVKSREKDLLSKGYALMQTKGVPQGASTSCGLSILNLDKLFDRHKSLLMYADDGIIFPESEEEVELLDVEEAGVVKAEHKSAWVRKNGEWCKSLKFLGLEYIPAGIKPLKGGEVAEEPRLRAHTRGLKDPEGIGSRLEFTEREQLIAFLAGKYEGMLKDLSRVERGRMSTGRENVPFEEVEKTIRDWVAKGLEEMGENSRLREWWKDWERELDDLNLGGEEMRLVTSDWKKQTVGSWIEARVEEFMQLTTDDRLKLLFSTSSGPTLMAGMYNGSWEPLEENSVVELEVRRGSWCANHWASYLIKLIRSGKFYSILDRIQSWEETTEEERMEITESLEYLGEWPSEDQDEALQSLFRWKSNEGVDLEENPLISPLRESWKKLIKWVEVDLWNSSSQATDDLLNELKEVRRGGDLEWIESWSEREIVKGYKPLKLKTKRRSPMEKIVPAIELSSEERNAVKEEKERRERRKSKKREREMWKELKREWKDSISGNNKGLRQVICLSLLELGMAERCIREVKRFLENYVH